MWDRKGLAKMRVMLVANYLYDNSVADAAELEAALDLRGVDVVRAPSFGFEGACDVDGVDLVVSLGGDGTLLRAAHLVGGAGVPILGLSYGHLGFLTCEKEGMSSLDLVCAALAGDLHKSARSAISARLYGIDSSGREAVVEAFALNEVVLARGGSGKMVEFDVDANGCHIDRLRGDGFVVATATGSTGYALSAGGPIVSPEFRGLVCVPVAPHTITARAFLTSPSDVVALSVAADRSTDRCVFADGEPFGTDLEPLRLEVSVASERIYLMGTGRDDFFASVSRVFYGKVR